jgi:hypothetical protein
MHIDRERRNTKSNRTSTLEPHGCPQTVSPSYAVGPSIIGFSKILTGICNSEGGGGGGGGGGDGW